MLRLHQKRMIRLIASNNRKMKICNNYNNKLRVKSKTKSSIITMNIMINITTSKINTTQTTLIKTIKCTILIMRNTKKEKISINRMREPKLMEQEKQVQEYKPVRHCQIRIRDRTAIRLLMLSLIIAASERGCNF